MITSPNSFQLFQLNNCILLTQVPNTFVFQGICVSDMGHNTLYKQIWYSNSINKFSNSQLKIPN
jgi:hypothetical protein